MNDQDRAFISGAYEVASRLNTKVRTMRRLHKKITPTIALEMIREARDYCISELKTKYNTHGRKQPLAKEER
jgi:hypothetical protein